MKRVILAAVTLISVAFVGSANAQTSGNVTVNIKLKPIHTIVVTPAQATVDLVYSTKDQYANGVFSNQADQLTIFSTGGFVVNAKIGAKFKNDHADSTPIDDNEAVSIQAAQGTNNELAITNPTITLNVTDQEFIKSALGGRDKKFSVKYTGAGGDKYLNKYDKDFVNPGENIYHAVVTYSIIAD